MVPNLPRCTFPYPGAGEDEDDVVPPELPADYADDPLKYLPACYNLSPEESDLAEQYGKGDFTGGYLASQIAHFRRGKSPEAHQERRKRFRAMKHEVLERGFVLPPLLERVIESDDAMDRLRHNTIWLTVPHELVAFPHDSELLLFLIARESQGADFWHLLLSPAGEHLVTWCGYGFGMPGYSQDEPAEGEDEFFCCAESFDEWAVRYFLDSAAGDRRYDELLAKYG